MHTQTPMRAKGRRPRSGQSFLATVLVIGVIVVSAGVTLLFLSNAFLGEGYGYRAAVNSQAVAGSGANDALVKIDRNPGLATGAGVTQYNLTVGAQTAAVTITPNSPVSSEASIVSSATVFGSISKITVVVAVDPSTGAVSVVSWQATAP